MSSEKKPQPVTKAWLLDGTPCSGPCFQAKGIKVREELVSRADSEATIEALRAERDEAWGEYLEERTARMNANNLAYSMEQRAKTAEARVAQLEAALEPSAATKAAYDNRFSMGIEVRLGRERENRSIQIPWDAIVRIMDAIRARALLSDGGAK